MGAGPGGAVRPGAGGAHLSAPGLVTLTRDACAHDLADRVLALRAPAVPLRVGVEVEWIPLAAEGGAPVPPLGASGGGTLPLLRRHGAALGWREEPTAAGLPRFLPPEGGTVSYEPGGQVELATPPCPDVAALDVYLRRVARPLVAAAADAGIVLLSRGMDPVNPASAVPLHLDGERYRRQARHYERFGPAGRRMMLRTAALHVNVDLAGDALARWRAANAAAPFLVAAFANSPRLEGRRTGRRSERAEQWRRLDAGRTGWFPPGPGGAGEAVEAYLEFALAADAFLLGPPGVEARPFRRWLDEGVDLAAWNAHLSTLFPEARPRGYLEIRSFDALPEPWTIVPAVVACGLLYDPDAAREAASLAAGPCALERAGRDGVGDPELREGALRALDLALEGAGRLGEAWFGEAALDATRAFRERFTAAGRDPGHEDDPLP